MNKSPAHESFALEFSSNYYDVLDLKPDASPQEVREAYIRTKSAYNKDCVAIYTLVSPEESAHILRAIEEAYFVLSNPQKRREYDRYHGIIGMNPGTADPNSAKSPFKVVSIDRVPPMEAESDAEALLNPPTTDFAPAPVLELAPQPTSAIPSAPMSRPVSLSEEIQNETEWHGHFLRKVREERQVSIEEMSEATKITKTYVLAIEEENFSKLPAQVYIRGFITQISKLLKLPQEKVASAYLARYHEWHRVQKTR